MGMQTREKILQELYAQIRLHGHCIGVAAGSGMTARCAVQGGADFILALSAGRFRQIGLGSFASLLSYSNSNSLVMEFGARELLRVVPDTPVIFGLNATDPTIDLYEYLKMIKARGFAGINNFPTVGLMDGNFRTALEAENITFDREVEAIRLANFLGMFTVAFVFDQEQAKAMVQAGADIICVHFGLTVGGKKGPQKALSMEHARIRMDQIMELCEDLRPGIIKMIYGGPISKPADVQYFYTNPLCMGYIGGSAFERIPVENALAETVRAFRNCEEECPGADPPGRRKPRPQEADDIAFVRYYIEKNYMDEVSLSDLAAILHRSVSYLSTEFKHRTGVTFSQYLMEYRMGKAAQLLKTSDEPLLRISDAVGYRDYAHFSKMFKKHYGCPPSDFRQEHVISCENENNNIKN